MERVWQVAEMLRSVAVAFVLQQEENVNDNVNVRLGLNKEISTNNSNNNYNNNIIIILAITKVETRSILTLKVGFVSMHELWYIIQLDCNSKLVDFMKRDLDDNAKAVSMREIQVSSSSAAFGRRPLLMAKVPDLIPVPVTEEDEVEISSSARYPSTTVPEHDHDFRFAFPKLSFPHIFLPLAIKW